MRKYIIIMLIIALATSFILGLYLYRLNIIDEQIAFETEYQKVKTENIIKKAESILKETNYSENKTSPNTKLTEKIYYNDCGHLVETSNNMKEEHINKTESEFQIEYIGWKIQKFTQNEVVVYKEVYDYCKEHYILKDVEGEIVIYLLDKYDNEKEIIRETGIQTQYLSEIDIENLKTGIKVCGIKELNKLLEDFE